VKIMEDSMEDPAIARFREMLARDPRSMAFAPLAEALRKSGRFDEAIAVAEGGLKAHPGYLGGLVVLGRALFDKKDIQRAYDILFKVMKENPDNYMAAKTLARIHLVRGEASLALTAFRSVRALMPGDKEVEEELAKLEEAGVRAAEPVPPPPPPLPVASRPPSTGAAAGPADGVNFAIPGIMELPAEEKGPPPSVVKAAGMPGNPFAPDEGIHSMLGDVGGPTAGEEDTGTATAASFFEELPLGDAGYPAGDTGGAPDGGREDGIASPVFQVSPAAAGPDLPGHLADATGEPAASEPSLATETLARLYAEQGARQEAHMVREAMGKGSRPFDVAQDGAPGSGAPELVTVLEGWLAGAERMRRR
jgi:tetratricopeptide (TPR) repeat protein